MGVAEVLVVGVDDLPAGFAPLHRSSLEVPPNSDLAYAPSISGLASATAFVQPVVHEVAALDAEGASSADRARPCRRGDVHIPGLTDVSTAPEVRAVAHLAASGRVRSCTTTSARGG